MKVDAQIQRPEAIMVSITTTMSLKDWLELSSQLPTSWPSSEWRSEIVNIARQLQKQYYAKEDDQ